MNELGLEIQEVLAWFPHVQDAPYVLVRVSDTHAQDWATKLGVPVRRCYISDSLLEERSKRLNVSKAEIVDARLPDPGSTMSGDFGEILVYLYQAAREHPATTAGPKKWRLKQDRTKPAPLSDVLHFVLPSWPAPSANDVLLCAEVKAKATNADSSPIKSAIEDSAKDRTSRLARTLLWFRERALTEDLGDIQLAHLDRFINATAYPPAMKRFRAVAVVCSSLVDGELGDAPTQVPTDYSVVVLSVPELKKTYTAVFDAVRQSTSLPPAVQVPVGGTQ